MLDITSHTPLKLSVACTSEIVVVQICTAQLLLKSCEYVVPLMRAIYTADTEEVDFESAQWIV